MESQQVTLVAKAHNGKIRVSADIPVSSGTDTYVVTIAVTPQIDESPSTRSALDQLYGALADSPMLKREPDTLPETRDDLLGQE